MSSPSYHGLPNGEGIFWPKRSSAQSRATPVLRGSNVRQRCVADGIAIARLSAWGLRFRCNPLLSLRLSGFTYMKIDPTISKRQRAVAAPSTPRAADDDKFRRIFQYSTDALSITRIETGRYLEVNDEFVRMSGYPREQVIGRTPEELGFWRDSPESRAFSEKLLREGVVRNHETSVAIGGGRHLHILISAVFIEVDGQQCTLGISRDISDLKSAQEQLGRADRRLQDVLSNAPVAMTVIDTESKITLSKGAGLTALGLAQNEMVGLSIFDVVSRESSTARHAREALAGKAQTAVENLNGHVFEVWYSPVRGAHERIVGAMSVATDITERVLVAEELRRKEEYYRSLIEISADTVLAIDPSNTIRFVGGDGPRTLGYSSCSAGWAQRARICSSRECGRAGGPYYAGVSESGDGGPFRGPRHRTRRQLGSGRIHGARLGGSRRRSDSCRHDAQYRRAQARAGRTQPPRRISSHRYRRIFRSHCCGRSRRRPGLRRRRGTARYRPPRRRMSSAAQPSNSSIQMISTNRSGW